MSKEELAAIKSTIAEYLQKGWIHPSANLYSAPVIVIHKKDGALRICINYRLLNKKTQINTYPIPCIDGCWIDSQKCGFTPSWALLRDTTKLGSATGHEYKMAFLTCYGT